MNIFFAIILQYLKHHNITVVQTKLDTLIGRSYIFCVDVINPELS